MAEDELKSEVSAQTERAEDSEPGDARIVELEGLLAGKEEELGAAKSRAGELEQRLAGLESETAALKLAKLDVERRLAEAGDALAQSVTSYRALVVESNPVVPAEMIGGDTIEAINSSLAKAKELIGRVRGELEAEVEKARIPAGAPQRAPLDLSALSAREKIKYAIGGNR